MLPFYAVPLPIGPEGKPLEIQYGQLLGIALILFLASVNYLGVRVGGQVQIAVTAVKLGLIGALIIAGLTWGQGSFAHFSDSIPANPGGVSGFFAALVAALWAYDGWNNAGMLGSEIENPQRNLPRALLVGTSLMIAIYLLTNLAYFYVLSGAEVGATPRVAAEAMQKVLGKSGASVVSIAAMISIFAALNGSILSGARVPYAMARDGLFFRRMSHINPYFRTPGACIVLLGVVSSIILLSGRYDELATLVNFPSWIFYGMTAASVIVLRVKRPEMNRPFRVPGYPLVPIFIVLVAIALLYSTLLNSPRESGIGLVLIIAGLPFYFFWKRRLGIER